MVASPPSIYMNTPPVTVRIIGLREHFERLLRGDDVADLDMATLEFLEAPDAPTQPTFELSHDVDAANE